MRMLLFLALLCSVALASPSRRMSRESAARLDRSLQRLERIDEAERKLRADMHAEVYEHEVREICAAHQLACERMTPRGDSVELGDGSAVNLQTGDITRPSPSPAPVRK